MKEKFNQFMEKCKENKKKTGLLLLAMFFLFLALGFGIYSLTTANEPIQKVAEKESKPEKKVEQKKAVEESKKEKPTVKDTKVKEEKIEEKQPEKKEEAPKSTETEIKAENKAAQQSKPSAPASKPVAPQKPVTSEQKPVPEQKPVAPQEPPHTHNFQPVYTQKWVVDQPAWTETVETPVYEMVERTYCNTCGADITCVAEQHLIDTMHAGYRSTGVQQQTGTTTQTINHPEVGHSENVISHYQCSCGATQ